MRYAVRVLVIKLIRRSSVVCGGTMHVQGEGRGKVVGVTEDGKGAVLGMEHKVLCSGTVQ